MFGLILFIVLCVAFLLWLLLNPSGQAFARNVEIQRKAKEAEQQVCHWSFSTCKKEKLQIPLFQLLDKESWKPQIPSVYDDSLLERLQETKNSRIEAEC